MNQTILSSFSSELQKLAAVSSLTQDALGGVDPFGNWTSQYGQKAQQAGLSEGQHRKKQLVSAAGGLVGGAVVVPSAISGLIGAAQGAARSKGGIGARIAGAGRGLVSGAKEPMQLVHHGRKATKLLGRTAKGTTAIKPTASQKKSLDFVKQRATVGNAGSPGGVAPGKAMEAAKQYGKGSITPEAARAAHAPARTAYVQGVSQLGLGGAIGSGGAYVQYAKGRSAEKDFQKRMNSR